MGLPYHLLLGARDWRPAIARGGHEVVWDAGRGEVTLRADLPPIPGVGAVTLADRRGAAADRFGHLYWISGDRTQIVYRPAGSRDSGVYWSTGDLLAPPPAKPKNAFRPLEPPAHEAPELWALTATRRGYLVVGTRAPAGLLTFDLHGGGPPAWQPWPDEVPFAPLDMAPDPCGGLWILDVPESIPVRLWYLDRDLRIGAPPGAERTLLEPARIDTFHEIGGIPRLRPETTHPAVVEMVLAVPLGEVTPAGIESLPDGSLLLLDQGPFGQDAMVHRLICGQAADAPIDLLDRLQEAFTAAPDSAGHDLAFRPSPESGQDCRPISGTLYVAMAGGNQAFAFDLEATLDTLDLVARTDYLPMRRFAGKALVAGPCDVHYDQPDAWLALTRLPRPRFVREGSLGAITFDSRAPGTVWHRLFLDGLIPAGDRIVVKTRCADRTEDLDRAPWRVEQPLYRRTLNRRNSDGDPIDEDERPHHRPFTSDELATDRLGTWELLFQQAVGRLIEIRLTVSGSGRTSPRIRALRVYYPRLSYPDRFLPAAYREDPVSANFLERYLAIFEGIYTELGDRIAAVETLFDSRTAPAEGLDWLAAWLGASLDDDWDEARRRLFLRNAMTLYRSRGTLRGIVWAIRLATEDCPDDSIFTPGADGAPFDIRISEGFDGSALPAVVPSNITFGPGHVATSAAWSPEQGAARLDRLWRDFLQARHAAGGDRAALLAALASLWEDPPADAAGLRVWSQTPDDPGQAGDRAAFLKQTFPRGYADIGPADAAAHSDYLARKYATTGALNEAYGLTGASAYAGFAGAAFPAPDRMPPDGAPLLDWIEFATVDLAASRHAHTFTVLVPVKPEETLLARQSKLDRIGAVVERERPAHTRFDVRPYWALFRTGSARVGLDTVMGEGARFTALVLNAGYLGASLVGSGHPYTVSDRWVSGRDRPGAAIG